jgi:hypothetical protein
MLRASIKSSGEENEMVLGFSGMIMLFISTFMSVIESW